MKGSSSHSDELQELRAQGVRVIPSRSRGNVSKKPPIKNLNNLLQDICVRDKPLRDKDFPKYFNVFKTVSLKLNNLMKQVDPYYERFSGVQFAGSRDRLRVNKPDGFDMDIVIGLPVNAHENTDNPALSDVVIENVAPNFVQLKMGTRIQMPNRDEEDREIKQTVCRWLDDENYLLRSLFMDWFKSVVDKAMKLFDQKDKLTFVMVEGDPYTLTLADASGPACTLVVENPQGGFRIDVDLVPAVEFCGNKYRRKPKECKKGNFMVVPKSMQGAPDDRCWRLPLHLEECDLLYMNQTIRLIKKLRDSTGMEKIPSYYIKTMFYHEAVEHENNTDFWSRHSLAELFTHMVKKLHQYLEDKSIPCFWDGNINLIGNLDEAILDGYAKKVKRLVNILGDPSEYKKVAKFLLSENQFKEYKKKVLNI